MRVVEMISRREQIRTRPVAGAVSADIASVVHGTISCNIRSMKTNWGSCNRETRHLWFNVELAKKHPDCLEYIVAHEMTHYFERNHGGRFTKLMDTYLPDWRSRRDQLNGAPLAEEAW